MKTYVMPLVEVLTTGMSSSALITAERLFQVLTIDNDDGTGLYYIDIS